MKQANKEWFRSWFDSPLYHKLYRHRNDREAHTFLKKLVVRLGAEQGDTFLDLGCGRGRCARYLGDLGYSVLGVDLSPNSINYARQFEHGNLHFKVHDMRLPIKAAKFKYVFSIFTSFGYFNTVREELAVLEAIREEIREDGTLVIDYMNCKKSLGELIEKEELCIEDTQFSIRRWACDNRIYKQINAEGKQFKEQVRIIDLAQFKEYARRTGFEIREVFGDYNLNPFREEVSPRMIMTFSPKNRHKRHKSAHKRQKKT